MTSRDTTILCRTPEIAKALVEVLYLNCVEGLIGDCLADRAVSIEARPHAVLADFADVASFVQADGSTGPVPHMFEDLAAAQAACPSDGMVVSAAEAESMVASPSS